MLSIRKTFRIIILLSISLTTFPALAQSVKEPAGQAEWTRPYPPFRIAGNLYYVGTYDLACYLITTPKGNILINSGLASSAAMIRRSIEKLGFKFSDTKILLAAHAHFDHVGGMADLKKQTGAKMMIQKRDAPVLADGGISDYVFGGKNASFKPVKADRLLKDHDTVRLGGMNIVLLHHPGHTKGASSFSFKVKDSTRSYRILIANMPSVLDETNLAGMPGYPDVAKDYAYTLRNLKSQQFDLWFASHASQFHLHQKHQPGDKYNPEAFRDQKGFDQIVNELNDAYLKKLHSK